MPSLLHEAVVMLFRDRPSLAPELLRDALGFALPAGDVGVADPSLVEIVPSARAADLVVLVGDPAAPRYGIVVEAQLRRDTRKRLTWPFYATALRARLRCPTCVLVVAPRRDVAAWAATPISLGAPGCSFMPAVLGPEAVPWVIDAAEAIRSPELAVLSAVAHGNAPAGAEVVLAAVAAVVRLDDERARLYNDIIWSALGAAARRELEEIMASQGYQYQSEFARKYYGQGREEGQREGAIRALKALLAARGFGLSREEGELIESCRDLATLEAWITRAATADSARTALGL